MVDFFHRDTLKIKIDKRIVRPFYDIGNGEKKNKQDKQENDRVQNSDFEFHGNSPENGITEKTVSDHRFENGKAENDRSNQERAVFGKSEEIPVRIPAGTCDAEHGFDIYPCILDIR